MLKTQSQPKQSIEMIAWHNLPLGDVFAQLNSKRDGLSQGEAKKRLDLFGFNIPASPKLRSGPGWHIFFKQFLDPLVIILLIASCLAVYIASYFDMAIILLAALLNIVIGFLGEGKTKKSLNNLKNSEIKLATVFRDNRPRQILSSEIAPGDIILLKPGDIIPADARLIKSYGLKVDENILTGKSNASFKNAGMIKVDALIFQRTNIIYGGTSIQDGTAEALVFATGQNSEISQNRQKLTQISSLKNRTPFEKRIAKLSRFLSLAVIILSAAIMLWGLIFHKNPEEIFLAAAAVAVAAAPTSLPLAVSLILGLGLRRILKAGGLARSSAAAEILGSAAVILTAKTGILTQGELRIAKFLTPERREGILELNATVKSASNHLLALTYGMLAGNAIIENPQDESRQWIIQASPIEKALVIAGGQAGLDYEGLNKKFKKIYELPFHNTRKFSATIREINAHENWLVALGSPDVLFNQLQKIQIMNRFEKLLPFELNRIKESIDNLAKDGLKVLTVCSKKIESDCWPDQKNEKEIMSELNLVGLIGLKDTAREEVKIFFKTAHKSGLKIIMVSGDHSLTGRAVAKEIGLLNAHHDSIEIMEGRDIDALDATELKRKISSIDIFSRVTPQQKLKLVEAFQAQGEVAAIIGHGVNDAPALKKADIGVALSSGAALTRASSDLILLENSLITLIKAITEGRIILDNIKKVIAYLLSTSLVEIILIGLSVALAWPLPLLAVQILWINLAHQSLPVMALAADPTKKDLTALKPAPRSEPIINNFMRFIIMAIGAISALMLWGIFYFLKQFFDNISYAQTVVFIALGLTTLNYAFSIQNFKKPIWEIHFWKNKYLIGAYLIGIILLAAAIYLPPLKLILKTQSLGLLEWIIAWGVSILNIILIEITKWLFIKRKKRHNESYY